MKLCRGVCNYIGDSLAKGSTLGFNGSTGTSLPKKQGVCCLDSRGSRHFGLHISAIGDFIAEPTSGIMCRDIMNM